ncbi:PH domain-containing protein [Streptomyces huiliensis]|uniref:PH domain-containing protein n=1 Tax=Streptomyces huiliensis TaxID=2876027 RepID=UPI001CBE8D08|nr:PH domain-containing protein [Streptomyces huiliensis]MBZ4318923.1 PH domain-containing protein [Streptomyces huiliensis]
MNELIFRGKDRYRPSGGRLVVILLIFTGELAALERQAGAVGFRWALAGTAVLIVFAVLYARRCRTVVGSAGITTSSGLGRGRTYPWHEIRWIDVREIGVGAEKTRAVRVTLADGRRRTLHGLHHSYFYPAPDFDVAYRQVVNWWESATGPADRGRPPLRWRDRVTPRVFGMILGAVLVVVGLVVVLLGS